MINKKQMLFLSNLFLILVILIAAWPVWGATYYVKNGGDDSAAGTSDGMAWATCPGMYGSSNSHTLVAGDIVYFDSQSTWVTATPPTLTTKAGVTYYGKGYGSGPQQRAILKVTGSGPNPNYAYGVVQIGVSNVTFSGFEIDAQSTNNWGIDACHYFGLATFGNILIDDCYIHHCGDAGHGANGIYIGASNGDHTITGVTIKNCTVHDIAWGGISVYPAWGRADGNRVTVNNVLIQNCTIYNTGIRSGGEGIYIKDDVNNITVEYCNIYNTDSGVHFEESEYAGDLWIDNAVIRYNLIHDNRHTGIDFQPRGYPINASIYGNLIWNNSSAGTIYGHGILIPGADYGANRASSSSTINIYNNTIAQISIPGTDYTRNQAVSVGQYGAAGAPTSATINFKNNIVYQHKDYLHALYESSAALTHSNNLIFQDNTPHSGEKWVRVGSNTYDNLNLNSWETVGVQVTSPSFTGGALPTGFSGTYGIDMVPNTNYFAINSGDALGKGVTLGSPYNGYINGAGRAMPITRPDSAYDIGAYQYHPQPSAPLNLRVFDNK